jgi:hypothetical protein
MVPQTTLWSASLPPLCLCAKPSPPPQPKLIPLLPYPHQEEAAEADAEDATLFPSSEPCDDGTADGALERLTASALSLREPFTPSAAKLTPAAATLSSAVSIFISAAAPRTDAVGEAAAQFTSPGRTGGAVGEMRAAAVGAEGVCATLSSSKHAEVKAACARAKKACVVSGKVAERLGAVVRAAAEKNTGGATRLERGAGRLREALGVAEGASGFARRAAAALLQTMDEDLGQVSGET